MAIYDNLPVFKQAYDLLLQILRFTSSVQRDFRYTVGETLKKDVIELCLCIYRAKDKSAGGRREKPAEVSLIK